MNYFIGLIDDMTLDELEVWRLLCKYSDFETRETGYTINQIVIACDKRLGLTTQKVRTILKKFIDKGFVGNIVAGTKGKETRAKLLLNDILFNENKLTIIQQQSNNDLTNKVEELQGVEGIDNNNLTTKQQSFNNTIKEQRKKNNNIYKDLVKAYTSNNDLVEAINDFISMRRQIKKPLSERALRGILNKLDKFGSNDIEKIEMLENSIEHCWLSVFELNNKKAPVGAGTKEFKKSNYNQSICNNQNKYTRGVEIV